MLRLLSTTVLLLTSLSSIAGTPQPPNNIPEPSALALLGIGVAAGLIVWSKNRNKK